VTQPDYSDYVVHFTKHAAPFGNQKARAPVPELDYISSLTSAFDRLMSILERRIIYATNMPWTDSPCVCFTECVWSSLLSHAQRYSQLGVGFKKEVLFRQGGGPAFYVRQDLWAQQNWPTTARPFVTPFVPRYAPQEHVNQFWNRAPNAIDFTHEREWRVPPDFAFADNDVSFLVVQRYEDEARMPKEIKDAIGRDRILIMDNYRQISRLWPGVSDTS
jgi:hypothetical protein